MIIDHADTAADLKKVRRATSTAVRYSYVQLASGLQAVVDGRCAPREQHHLLDHSPRRAALVDNARRLATQS